jgi:Concanavalin A-like lectin/glucanases superfamily
VSSTLSAFYASSAAIWLLACGVNVAEPIGPASSTNSGGTAGSAGNAAADPLSRGLVAYWKLDEPDAAEPAVDSVSGDTALSGTPVNGPEPSSQVPKVGFDDPGSRSFDGQDQYLLIKDNDALDFAVEITLAAWVNVSALNDSCQYIIGHGYCLDPPGEVVLRIGSTSCGPGVAPHYWAAGSWLQAEHSATAVIDETDLGKWLHLVGTYDGEAWHLYRNGEEIGTQPSTVGAVPVRSDWAIGARAPGVPPCVPQPDERFFNGSIDDVRIYRRALDAAEVLELYHR